jgi:hypothetical protein
VGSQHDGTQQAQILPRPNSAGSNNQREASRDPASGKEGFRLPSSQWFGNSTSTSTTLISSTDIQQYKPECNEFAYTARTRSIRWFEFEAKLKRSNKWRNAAPS